MKRRNFLLRTGQVSLAFLGLQAFASIPMRKNSGTLNIQSKLSGGYGPLIDDPNGIMNLPKGFSYDIISRQGDRMSDGFFVPGAPDGMATFEAPGNKIIIIRNHEVSAGDITKGPFGNNLELLNNAVAKKLYDYGNGKLPCMGGTTTILYNPATKKVEEQYLSLAGTIRNCAGGPTPWNSWISCEEDMSTDIGHLEKFHGYAFEVPAQVQPELFTPEPIRAMGRFNHEAVAVDPKTGIVYQTEDRIDGLIYRYIPKENGNLQKGGKLQILSIKGQSSFSTRNWIRDDNTMEARKKYDVEWLDINNINPIGDDLRIRGRKKGAAIFARGEGMWFGTDEVYFACTNGGKHSFGQIFRYTPSIKEGQPEEINDPGTLELFIDSDRTDLMQSCDNLTVGANGDLVICEDLPTPRIVGVSMEGKIYHIAKNVGFKSEFAGATFSPDGKILFVNIQDAGLTIAINGPWGDPKIG